MGKFDNTHNNDTFIIAYRKARKRRTFFLTERLEKYNLSPNQIDILSFIKNNTAFNTAKDIVEYTGVSKGLISRSVEDLSNRAFITLEEDSSDKRKQRIFLTNLGNKIANLIKKYDKLFFHVITEGIPMEELEIQKKVAEKILANMEKLKY